MIALETRSVLASESIKRDGFDGSWFIFIGRPRRFSINNNITQFDLVRFGSVDVVEMFLFGGSFWVSVSTLLVALFGFIDRMFFRDSDCVSPLFQEVEEASSEVTEFNFPEVSVSDEENSPKFFSKFQFKRYEEVIGSNFGDAPKSSTNKYQFMSGKAFGVFMEEPEALSFTVKELYADSNNTSFRFSDEEIDKALQNPNSEAEPVEEQEANNDPSDQDFDIDSYSVVSTPSHDFSGFCDVIDSSGTGFLSDRDFENAEVENKHEEEDVQKHEQSQDDVLASEMLSEDDFHDNNNVGGKCKVLDLEDSTGFESLWEHQDLIEQLEMELKKVRATGLPTILEEYESPKIMEDLKPWKIDDKFQQQDTMGELHRFYKSYRERMRKFDILNYQKMYAIGFLQSKDPLESVSISKSSIPVIGPLLSEIYRRKKSKSEPMVKFMRELHSDLEMVYVGQLCLSWEFLHWQYEKTLDLWESDPRGIRRYNEVAGEFQQFQVLMQRFIENETFEGPRVQNYVKNRCVLRNLLQVPVIREDIFKDKKRARRTSKGNDAITSDMLVEIMEESIRIFWLFLRADKDAASNGLQISRRENHVEVQDPSDRKLLIELRADLHKKERKLKEILRSGNCILRRFQKHEESSNTEQVLYFFSQVDMKLVARVLNMSRVTTDQLLWCHNKLSKISLVNRKISVEPSFLLFPC